MNTDTNANPNPVGRVIGLDAHPDSFTAAIVQGQTPAQALVQKTFNKVPMGQLQSWAKRHLHSEDLVVLEASGNSFNVVRSLEVAGITAYVLESRHVGKLKETHANNDKISAVRIAKAWLAGTAKKVWVPDTQTQERRDLFHAHQKAVKRTTQLRCRLLSYLSDNGVRLPKGTSLTELDQAQKHIEKAAAWSPRQRQIIEGLLMELRHADVQRKHWRSLIAQEVLNDPLLLSLVRLCGVREMVAFALGAFIGDIKRFAKPGSLVKYLGLYPALDESGAGKWEGGVRGQGRKDVRSLLVEAAHSILRSSHPITKWAKKLLARKGELKLVVTAVARKLAVAVWYLMMGRWNALEEIDSRTRIKIGRILSQVGAPALKKVQKTAKTYRAEVTERLLKGRIYELKAPLPATPAT